MNSSVTDYIRQVNHTATTVDPRWLVRLKSVEAGVDAEVPTPEIVLVHPMPEEKRKPVTEDPPITFVNRNTESLPTNSAQSECVNDSCGESVASEACSGDSSVQVVTAESVEKIGRDLYQKYNRRMEATPDYTLPEPIEVPEEPENPAQNQRSSEVEDQVEPIENEMVTVESEGQIIELKEDPGLSPEQLQTADTIPDTELDVLKTIHSLSGKSSDDQDMIHSVAASVQSDHSIISFPKDRRSERFDYRQSKRQQLIDAIVDQIVDRFPPGTPATILLVGPNHHLDTDGAASKIATCLASRHVGPIALVDANHRSGQLTSFLGLENSEGIIDISIRDESVQSVIRPTDHPNLSVVGAGAFDENTPVGPLPGPRTTCHSLKASSQYSIISGGAAGDPLSDTWSQLVDGVYLMVDVDESDREATIRAVEHYRNLGARVLGCIATRS